MCPPVLTVVLPPEKAEGCESYLQYLHPVDGVQEIHRDSSKAPGKKISLDVSSYVECSNVLKSHKFNTNMQQSGGTGTHIVAKGPRF